MTAKPEHFANHVIMMRPAAFGFNPETAASNTFQRAPAHEDIVETAMGEFDAMAESLTQAGITVEIWADTQAPKKPDAVFPNNWISTHGSGRVHVYPLAADNRRAEVRLDLLEQLKQRFVVAEVMDWTLHTARCVFLEGTGSLVIDAANKRVFACRSGRTSEELVREWAAIESYEPVIFDALDGRGLPIYHTNVVLCIGHGFAACGLALVGASLGGHLREMLEDCGVVVSLDAEQIHRFAGNMLQLVRANGSPVLVLSHTALRSLRPDQLRALEQCTMLLPVAIPTIERVGGGSARCMLAELFLKPR